MRNFIFAIDDNNDFVRNIHENYDGDNLEIGSVVMEVFSDGEISPNFKHSIRGSRVFLVCSGTRPDSILRQCLAMDAARRASASEVVLVTPFFGYSRQDRKDGKRGAVGAKLMMNLYEAAGAHRILTVDLHADQIEGFTDLAIDHISGTRVFGDTLVKMIRNGELSNVTVVSPDAGGVKRSMKLSKKLRNSGCDVQDAIMSKHRDKPNSIESMTLIGDVSGRDVIIVDDMIDTAGTLKKAAETLKSHGANKIIAVAAHGVLSGKAFANIDDSPLTSVIVSDTIEKEIRSDKVRVVSCAYSVARFIKSINSSVSPLESTI